MINSFNHRLLNATNVPASCVCGAGARCLAPAAFLAQWEFTIGPSLDVRRADRWLCEYHGRQYQSRRRLELRGQVDATRFLESHGGGGIELYGLQPLLPIIEKIVLQQRRATA